MPKITELPQATGFDEGDILIKDGVNGTKKIPVSNAADYMGKNVIMINEDPTDGTKVVIDTEGTDYELALMSDVNAVDGEVDELKSAITTSVNNGELVEITEFLQGLPWERTRTDRCSSEYMRLYPGDVITVTGNTEGQKFNLSASGFESGWKTTDYSFRIVEEKSYYVGVAMTDGVSNIIPTDIAGLKIKIQPSQIIINKNNIAKLENDISSFNGVVNDLTASQNNWVKLEQYTKTVSGITFTSDGTKIIATGTATGYAVLQNSFTVPFTGKYLLSGCPKGGGTTKYYMRFNGIDAFDIGGGVYVDLDAGQTYTLWIVISINITVNNLEFIPALAFTDTTDVSLSEKYRSPDSAIVGEIIASFDKNTNEIWELGAIGSGGENYNISDAIRTRDYIEIENVSFEFDYLEDMTVRVSAYDDSKTFIQRIEYTEKFITKNKIKEKITVIGNIKYIRIAIYKTGLTPYNYIPVKTYTSDNSFVYDISKIHKLEKEQADVLKIQRTNAEAYGDVALRLLVMTDIHGDEYRTRRAVDLLNAWGDDYFDAAINCGDTCTSYLSDLAWYNRQITRSSIPVLNCVGNHDAWTSLSGNLADKKDVYNSIIGPVKSNVPSIVQPTQASENGLNYFYYDVDDIRIIILDCMYWDNTQRDWFVSVLDDARQNSKSVIGVSHGQFDSEYVDVIDCAWNLKTISFSTSLSALSIEAGQAVKSFMDNGGVFITWITGHVHGDWINKIKSAYGNQFLVSFPAFVQRASTVHKSQNPDAYNFDVLTYITVDTNTHTVRGLRIGANVNIEGAFYKEFAIDYQNGVLLSAK